MKALATKELNGKSAQHACESLRMLLPPEGLASLHRTLVEELLNTLKQVDVRSVREGIEQVDIVTAQPLNPADAQRLAQWAAAVVGAHVPVHAETDPAMVAGGLVRAGATIIDNSLANRLGQRSR